MNSEMSANVVGILLMSIGIIYSYLGGAWTMEKLIKLRDIKDK